MKVCRLIFPFIMLCLAVNLFAECPDATEPNDTPAQAVHLPIWTSFDLCVDTPNDLDYFTFDIEGDRGFYIDVVTAPSPTPVISMILLDADGLTEAGVPAAYYTNGFLRICGYSKIAGTYYLLLKGLEGYVGPYTIYMDSKPIDIKPQRIGNMLKIVKENGEIRFSWLYSWACYASNSATHFNIYQGTINTTDFFDLIAETEDFVYNAGRVTNGPSLVYYAIQTENGVGFGDTTPSFIKILTDPPGDFTISKAFPFSQDPCAIPNSHPNLPLTFRVWLQDRLGSPIDGVRIDFQLDPHYVNFFLHTFCPWPNRSASGVTGQDGPGEVDAILSVGGQLDPTTCDISPPEEECATFIYMQPEFVNFYDRPYVKYKFEE